MPVASLVFAPLGARCATVITTPRVTLHLAHCRWFHVEQVVTAGVGFLISSARAGPAHTAAQSKLNTSTYLHNSSTVQRHSNVPRHRSVHEVPPYRLPPPSGEGMKPLLLPRYLPQAHNRMQMGHFSGCHKESVGVRHFVFGLASGCHPVSHRTHPYQTILMAGRRNARLNPQSKPNPRCRQSAMVLIGMGGRIMGHGVKGCTAVHMSPCFLFLSGCGAGTGSQRRTERSGVNEVETHPRPTPASEAL
ncbi:hypothetical protein SKAU_G00317860 [Synaphobranchus kaupii]|uniref:Uncharacterized protein n=1 Tax=Synaphobranchus kaupii TaxID=118154 RepID=A0A9Q1ILX2_SYNKA|nr:hypothetical protein SKAU_G00317860 [Synaphobranchus kaupii]